MKLNSPCDIINSPFGASISTKLPPVVKKLPKETFRIALSCSTAVLAVFITPLASACDRSIPSVPPASISTVFALSATVALVRLSVPPLPTVTASDPPAPTVTAPVTVAS